MVPVAAWDDDVDDRLVELPREFQPLPGFDAETARWL